MVEHVIKHHFDVSYMGDTAELIYEEGDPRVQIGTEADGFVLVSLESLVAVVDTLSVLSMKAANDG